MKALELADRIFENNRSKAPVVHNISNIVTANDCANITLACGGSPTMAQHPEEVEDITGACSGFVINMGNIEEGLVEAMLRAGKRNNAIGHPVVLDPVGAGAAKKRNEVLFELLGKVKFSVIRGNISEIKFIATGSGSAKGVDADAADKVTDENIDSVIDFAKGLSAKTGAVIAISGETDIIADKDTAYVVKNGHSQMSLVTGTGCMLSSVTGVFCAANPDHILEAAVCAVSSYGLAGELAYSKMEANDAGTSSFRMYLIDYMSKMTADIFKGGAKIEIR
ncbi:hydroxyethylthiazole kinase [Lachnospiraceae bacterium NSJ-143]|nr:hydroxyethylthiazole kinase [Lachnospiraceae bacterium NSJ-143]